MHTYHNVFKLYGIKYRVHGIWHVVYNIIWILQSRISGNLSWWPSETGCEMLMLMWPFGPLAVAILEFRLPPSLQRALAGCSVKVGRILPFLTSLPGSEHWGVRMVLLVIYILRVPALIMTPATPKNLAPIYRLSYIWGSYYSGLGGVDFSGGGDYHQQ